MASASGVARVSYITSSRVVDVQSSSPAGHSAFGFSRFPESGLEAKPVFVAISKDADIAQAISTKSSTLTTVAISHPDAPLVSRLLIALPPVSTTPLVVNIAINHAELSRTLTLRSAAPFVLFSGSAHQAHDHALLAARLADTEKKAVLHIFLNGVNADEPDVEDIPEASIRSFMAAPVRDVPILNGNGHISNAQANGHANGHTSGSVPASPTTNGHTRVDSLLRDLDDGPDSDLYRAYSAASLSTLALVRRALKSSSYAGSSHPKVVAVSLSMYF